MSEAPDIAVTVCAGSLQILYALCSDPLSVGGDGLQMEMVGGWKSTEHASQKLHQPLHRDIEINNSISCHLIFSTLTRSVTHTTIELTCSHLISSRRSKTCRTVKIQ